MKILNERNAVIAIIVGAVIFFAIPVFFLWKELGTLSWSKTVNDSKLSSYGSLLSGLIGTIWSLAGVVLFYVALKEQRDDMRVNKTNLEVQTAALTQQVKEFELQRVELEETRKVSIEQSKTQNLQRFENTFFQMIHRQQSIVDSMSYDNKRGKYCFRELHAEVRLLPGTKSVEHKIAIFRGLFNRNQENLTNYTRHLTLILNLIDSYGLDNPQLYADILCAQWSVHEHCIIFYKGLTEDGARLKVYLERYGMFKDLNRGNVQSGGTAIFKEYKPEAYGEVDYNFLDLAPLKLDQFED